MTSPSSLNCKDVPGWRDSENADCDWYASPTLDDDFYDEDDTRCEKWGNDIEFANDGFTAKMACCTCGGGIINENFPDEISDKPSLIPTNSPSMEPPTISPSNSPSPQPSLIPSSSPTWGSIASTETKVRFNGIMSLMNQTTYKTFEEVTSDFIIGNIPTSSRPGLADYVISNLTTTVTFQTLAAGIGNLFFLDVTFAVSSSIQIINQSIEFSYDDAVLHGFTTNFEGYLYRLHEASNFFPEYSSGEIIGYAMTEAATDGAENGTKNSLPIGEILILAGIVGCALVIFVLVIQSNRSRRQRSDPVSIKVEVMEPEEVVEIQQVSP